MGDAVCWFCFDRGGYVLITKRLEKGTFRVPLRESAAGHVVVEAGELMLVLEGIDLRDARRRARWTPRVVPGGAGGS